MTTREVRPPGGGPAAARDRLLLAVLLLAALAARLYALTGDMRFDPVIYAQYAWNLLQGTFSLSDDSWYAQRLVVFAPVAPGFALFGVGALSSRLWPLALSLLQVGLVFELGRRLEGRATAVLAGLFVVLSPLDVVGGVTLQPDVAVAAFLCLAAYAWILAPERGRRGAVLWPVVSGAAFALAVQARESAAPFALLYLGTLLWRRDRGRACLLALLGAALVALPTLALYAAATGDAFHRFRVVTASYGDPAMREGLRLAFYPDLVRHVRYTESGAFAGLFALGLLAALARPRGARGWLLLWALPLLLYLQFGSMSLTEYVPVLKRERYLTCLTAPLGLLTASTLLAGLGGLLERLAPRLPAARRDGWRNALLALLVAVLAADSFLIVRDQRAAGQRTARAFRAVAELIDRDPGLPVLFDHWRTAHRVVFQLGFREGADLYHGRDDRARMRRPEVPARPRLGYLAWYPDSARVPAALVVLDDDALALVRDASPGGPTYFPGEIPGYAYAPPRSWRLLGAASTLRVYRTD